MDKLKQVLAQADTVLFIGSGISMWSGLPSWSDVIEELARFIEARSLNADLIRREAERGDLLQAASYGFDKLTKQQIGDFIRTVCRYGTAKPHEIHRKIVSLGPRCFITTNYDNLIEESLRKWQPDRFFRPPVTNRHLTETAEIVHAHATDFIFKPHGDLADNDSIILTREQYRQMLPQGERHNALESLKILLASRPVIYLGFGLRDPDFIYIRDLLANIYRGGIQDHYAIMADVAEDECDYWRKNYGIHLINYTTNTLPNKTKDHTALLTLLDSFLEPAPIIPKAGLNEIDNKLHVTDLVLSLARHAARLVRFNKVDPEFPIRVHMEQEHKPIGLYYEPGRFDYYPIEKFLDNGPERGVLVGLPGAGKSYSLSRAAARLAERLHEICLSEPFNEEDVVIPLFVDLKLYHGDLADLIGQTLSKSLSFDEMKRRFRLKVFLDAFNEMPREYLENGSYEKDFVKFIVTNRNTERLSIIISSRTSDGLAKFNLPIYCLDEIDKNAVATELHRRGIEISGRFDHEIRSLLQKPFYFQFIINGAISLSKEVHPRELYHSFFRNLHRTFETRFHKIFNIEDSLSIIAYNAINNGEEAYHLSDLLQILKSNIDKTGYSDIEPQDIANWLISTSVLIPYIGGRIAFVHQSITEYLAAKELAKHYQKNTRVLKEKLPLKRWDQALFLTLSFLPKPQAEAFFQDILDVDFELALNAVKYLEVDREAIVSKLLNQIPDRIKSLGPYESRIEWLLEYIIPLSESHEPQLRSLIKLGGLIGGAAATRLIEIKGIKIKDEMLDMLVEARSDYNFCCNGIASALKSLSTPEDIRKIVKLADSITDEVTSESDDEVCHGFIAGAAEFLSYLDISIIKKGFLQDSELGPIPEIHARILCDILTNYHSAEALNVAGELLLRGVKKAATSIYFIIHFATSKKNLSWDSFKEEHLDSLISIAEDPREESWSIKALKALCLGRPDLGELVKKTAYCKKGLEKAILFYCASPDDNESFFKALSEIATMSSEQRCNELTHLLRQIDINWAGHEALFVRMLKLRDSKLALTIIDQVYPRFNSTLAQLEIGPIEWWLDWLTDENDYWLHNRISWLLSMCVSKEVQHSFVVEFNKADSKYRAVLAHTILPNQNELTTDDFSADAISFLLEDLRETKSINPHEGHILGRTGTEQFVTERILPLLPKAKKQFLKNLKKVIRQAGSRHGKRYIDIS